MTEETTIQIKVKYTLIDQVRKLHMDYKEIPAVYIVDTAMRHFIEELKKEAKK
jgi:hypothetical protein